MMGILPIKPPHGSDWRVKAGLTPQWRDCVTQAAGHLQGAAGPLGVTGQGLDGRHCLVPEAS